MITLEKLQNGKEAIIKKIDGGFCLKERMCHINVREGKTITKVVSQPFSGPIIIKIGNRQCAIGRGIASKIKVKET